MAFRHRGGPSGRLLRYNNAERERHRAGGDSQAIADSNTSRAWDSAVQRGTDQRTIPFVHCYWPLPHATIIKIATTYRIAHVRMICLRATTTRG